MDGQRNNVGRECKKCGRIREEKDGPPNSECAFCGTNYDEFDATIARLRRAPSPAPRQPRALAPPDVVASAAAEDPGAPAEEPAVAPATEVQNLQPPAWRPASSISIPGLTAASYLRGVAILMLILLGIMAAAMLISAFTQPRTMSGAWGWAFAMLGAALVTPCLLIGFASVVTNIAEIRRLLHERLPERPKP